MTATISPQPKLQFFYANGDPLAGGKLYTYEAGTTTPKTTYTSYAATAQNTNPVILDSRGECSVWFSEGQYKFVLTDSADVEIWSQDNLNSADILALLSASSGAGLIGYSESEVYAAGTVGAALQAVINVKNAPYNAKGDGATDDTTAIQAAFTAAATAGGALVFFPKGTYIISQSVLISSNTTVMGTGPASLIKAKQIGFVGTNALRTCFLFRNTNWNASQLTDTQISISDMGFSYGNVTIVGGGAHCVSMRYVNNVTVRNCYFSQGENATALLACTDTLTENCEAYNMINCYFDHWDGAGTAKVISCVGKNDVGTSIAQGIQFTGTGTLLEDRTSADCYVAFNYLSNVTSPSGFSSAIIANSNDAGSYTYRMVSVENIVEDCNLGIVYSGGGGQHMSIGDTIIRSTGCAIFMQYDFTAAPSNCRVIDCHLINCANSAGNPAIIAISGTNNYVQNLKITNTTSAAYTLVAYFSVQASNCSVSGVDIPAGTLGSFSNVGTNCAFTNNVAILPYTPALSFGGAATGMTYSQQQGYYSIVQGNVFVTGAITLTNKGSSTGQVTISLPITAENVTMPGAFQAAYYNNMSSLSSAPIIYAAPSTSLGSLYQAQPTGIGPLTDANFTNTTIIYFSGWYRGNMA